MIPKINNRGHSFKGVTAYLAHDKGEETAERVAWSMTGNLHTNDLEKAARIMAFTDMNAEHLKRDCGGSGAGRKSEAGAVYHYSLSWAHGENPSQAHQQEEALKTLERLGLSEHQYFMVGHNDTDHIHLHVVANLTHQETGKRLTPSFDKKELSKYALEYEKEHGLQCQKRFENEQNRLKGEFLKHQDTRQDYAQKITQAYQQSDNGKTFVAALTEAKLTLAQGRRGGFVIVDETGNIQKLARQIDGVKTADIKAKLADIDLKGLQDADKLAKQRQQERIEENKGKFEEAGKQPEKPKPQQKKRPPYDRKQEKENRLKEVHQSKTKAEKCAENSKIREEKKTQNWDRDKANQAWKDSIAQAGIESEKQRIKEERERKTQGKETGKSGDGNSSIKPTQQPETQTKSYAEYLDKVREKSNAEWRQRDQLEDQLNQTYTRKKVEQALKAAQEKAEHSNTLWGRSTGQHRDALENIEAYKKTLANIAQRENEARQSLERKIEKQHPKTEQQGTTLKPEPKLTPEVKQEFEKTRISSNDNLNAIFERAEQKAKEKAQKRENAPDQSKDKGRDRGGFER